MKNSYTIGEFSQITGLSVKTLRFYHEKGILHPTSVDEATGYRHYDETKIEKARVIRQLRDMEFSIEDVAAVFDQAHDDAEVLSFLQSQKRFLQDRIAQDKGIVHALNRIIINEQEAKELLKASPHIVHEKVIDPILVAGIRMQGKYHEVGRGFSELSKKVGRHICGKPLTLYYDGEHRDEQADFEPCFPVRQAVSPPGISVRELPRVRCLSLVHRGAYDQLGRSYAKILQAASSNDRAILLPTREIYLKGPGMIFKGNPKNYLTEIILPLQA